MHSVLLLSGDIDTIEELRSILRDTYRLFEAQDTPDALRVLSSVPVDAAIIDTTLKNGDGIDGVRRSAEAFPDVPIIFVALDPKSAQGSQAVSMGAFTCISRPFDDDSLRFLVETAIEKQGLMRDLRHLRSNKRDVFEPSRPSAKGVPDRMPPAYHTEVIRKLSKAITSIHDLEGLISLLGSAMSEIFNATSTLVFIRDPVTKRYEPASMIGVNTSLFKDIWFDNDHGLARWLHENSQLLRRELAEALWHEGAYELSRDLKILKAEVVVPLSHQGELMGFVSLGMRINGMAYTDEDLDLLALISVYTGTALRNALDYRRISYSRVCSESILNNIRTGIIAIDTRGKITRVNPFAQKLIGLDPHRALGEDVQKAGSVIADILLRTLKNHSLYVHHEVRDPSAKATISVTTSLLRDEESEIIGAIAFFADLSEVKELQSKIEELKRVEFWSELSARMAHEIRNPLTSIKTFTQLFRERYNEPEFRENFVEIVGAEIEKIESITEQLVIYSRPFGGEVKPVEVNGLIDDAIIALGSSLKSKNIAVKKADGPEVVRVRGDREMLKEAFMRVLQNAIDFTADGGEILISTKVLRLFDLAQRPPSAVVSDTIPSEPGGELLDSAHYVEVEFKDNGTGISEENLSKVFTPFFSTKVKGIGLGLAIVEKAVQHHRGRIELDSQVGAGTSVRLIIPAYLEN